MGDALDAAGLVEGAVAVCAVGVADVRIRVQGMADGDQAAVVVVVLDGLACSQRPEVGGDLFDGVGGGIEDGFDAAGVGGIDDAGDLLERIVNVARVTGDLGGTLGFVILLE